MSAYVETAGAEFELEGTATPRPATSARSAPAISTRSLETITGGQPRRSPSAAPPRKSSSRHELRVSAIALMEIRRPGGRRSPDARGARVRARLHASCPRRRELLERAADGSCELERARCRRSSPRPRSSARRLAGAPAPADLRDRRVEITGPTDRKMMINALNSGARVFMADFEDANSPTWANIVDGQRNLTDAVARDDHARDAGEGYRLNDEIATLLVRPRGWHLRRTALRGRRRAGVRRRCSTSACVSSTTRASSSSAAAVRTSTCRSSRPTSRRGSGTTCSCSPRRARDAARHDPRTVLIETILAAFEMEEILYELAHCDCA